MRIRTKAATVLLASVAIALLIGYVCISRLMPSGNVPLIHNYSALASYRRNAFHSLHIGRETETPVYLFRVPPTEINDPPSFSGFTIRYVERIYMPHIYDWDKDQYVLIVWGDPQPDPTLSFGSRKLALDKIALTDGTAYENLNAFALQDGQLPTTAVIPGTMPSTNQVVFAARLGESRSWPGLSKPPLYECDSYFNGNWSGTYAVFRTAQEAASAHLLGSGEIGVAQTVATAYLTPGVVPYG